MEYRDKCKETIADMSSKELGLSPRVVEGFKNEGAKYIQYEQFLQIS